MPVEWTRTRVKDAQEPCPACGEIDYDEVVPVDGSRGGSGGHGHDGPLEPNRVVVCRRCGHEEGGGLIRFASPEDEDEPTRIARIRRQRAEERIRKYHADAVTLLDITFRIYAAEGWEASVVGSRTGRDDLTEITIGHYAERNDDPFAFPDLTVRTALNGRHDNTGDIGRQALESLVPDDDHTRPSPEGLSEAAIKLWFASRERHRRAAARQADRSEREFSIDGELRVFVMLRTATGRWVAVRHHEGLTITIAARNLDPGTVTLEPILDPAARLLGPEPREVPPPSV